MRQRFEEVFGFVIFVEIDQLGSLINTCFSVAFKEIYYFQTLKAFI